MEETAHALLVGPLATEFAEYFQLESQKRQTWRRPGSYGSMLKRISPKRTQHGTVGAVALDQAGTVAAGASTGGIDLMLPGRVGDTALIGCGVYADNEAGAVSMTGWGEGIIRVAVAKEICDRLGQGTTPAMAARVVLQKLMTKINGSAGALVLTPGGKFVVTHVTPHMAAGWWNGKGAPTVKDTFR